MFRKLLITFFSFFLHCVVNAQILPKENSVLNYRLIGFSSAAAPKEDNYTIEVATGYYNSEDSFKKNIVKTFPGKSKRTIGEVPFWDNRYTWRILNTSKNPVPMKSIFHHFATGLIAEADTADMRLRIIKPAAKYKDAYVLLDGSRTLCDMNGHPVWYLPNIPGVIQDNTTIRDLKLTAEGTITFIARNNLDGKIYEVNYDADILWKGPDSGILSRDSLEHYHHEFTRLNNGHYMALGNEMFTFHLPSSMDSPVVVFYGNKTKDYRKDPNYEEIPFGTILEYDKKGKMIWSWKSSDYFKNSDLVYRKRPALPADVEVHDNAFFFDEKNKIIYLSFKNISRIIKIKYPEGTVVETYGERYQPGTPVHGNGQFCGQHSCRRSSQGYLYFLNNNACNTGAAPKIMIMQEPAAKNGTLKPVWEYDCNIEGINTDKATVHNFEFSGNVFELPDHSMFTSMTGTETGLFIVSPDKKILWSAAIEKWDPDYRKWFFYTEYRASIITNHKDLERLIWNTGVKK